MQDPPGRQDTTSAGLTAAGEVIAAGTTGRWLRAVSQFGLVSRAAVYSRLLGAPANPSGCLPRVVRDVDTG
jgi:hypothetical protein